MRILAADTTTRVNTVALCDEDRVVVETISECGRAHSERLLDTIEWVLAEGGCSLAEVDALAVSVGPGSFTGVRVGVSAMKGLSLGLGELRSGGQTPKPLVGVPTLDAMARLVCTAGAVVCPMLDARMQEVFAAAYRLHGTSREPLLPPQVLSADAFFDALEPWSSSETVICLGDGAELYRDVAAMRAPRAVFAGAACRYPRASAVAFEALELVEQGGATDAALTAPVYLRKSQAEQARETRGAPAS
jgi:tRNA threonylcarbamoyladenosine biosynthesis protein TsaB